MQCNVMLCTELIFGVVADVAVRINKAPQTNCGKYKGRQGVLNHGMATCQGEGKLNSN